MENQYLAIDQFEDVEASTQFLLESIKRTTEKDIYWKQVLIFTYLAIQGTAVCCLTKSNLTGPFDHKTEKELLLYLNLWSQKATNEAYGAPWDMPSMEYPKERLANFDDLLKRLPDRFRVKISNKTEKDANKLEWSFIFVRNWRNDFSHFGPKHLLIHKEDIARHCKVCLLHILNMVNSPDAFANRSRFHQTNVAKNLEEAIELLANSKAS